MADGSGATTFCNLLSLAFQLPSGLYATTFHYCFSQVCCQLAILWWPSID